VCREPDAEQDAAEIREAATVFRAAILRCPRSDLPTQKNFPHGSCGDASTLLGQYLFDQSLGLWEYTGGERERDLHSHAWLECDGLIIDITADQFEDVDEPVIVTRDRSWHAQFVYSEARHPVQINEYDPGTQRWLWPIYERIMDALEGSSSQSQLPGRRLDPCHTR
jgi:hypothetical protein